MSEPRFKFEIAEQDLAFIKGLDVRWVVGDMTLTRAVKVMEGTPYILHVNSDHVIPIVNHEDRWSYEYLYAVNVAMIGGYHGVYADDEWEAIHLFADYCAEQVPDPENPRRTKQRFPGLIMSLAEAEREEYPEEFSGPWGNESWYFTERGHPATAERVRDPKIPPIPDGLFPYVYEAESDLPREEKVELAFYYLRNGINIRYREEWSGWLEDYIYDNRETLFVTSVQVNAVPGIDSVVITMKESDDEDQDS
jgi:hypothetical protein